MESFISAALDPNNENEVLTKVSGLICYPVKGKSFTNGAMIKYCMLVADAETCPEKLKIISLSLKTAH